jgi:dihydrofolate synthase/folylpolyglutamate synthase
MTQSAIPKGLSVCNLQSVFDYIQSLDRLDTPHHSRKYHFTQGIARARHLLQRLGGAPTATTRCVLVTGSKGKGSTAAMLSSILAAAGYRVGLFTGPHLHTPLERFSLYPHPSLPLQGESKGGSQMPEAAFIDLTERVRHIVETWDRPDLGTPTRFEAFTAMAYRWFEEQIVDVAVMEIGIGGRLDAVNLAEPMLSVITNISLEHTEILGKTLAEIAREKAGIMRAGRPVVIAHQTDEALATLCAEAQRVGARPVLAEDGWRCAFVRHEIRPERSGQWFTASKVFGDEALFTPLLGAYQLQNAATTLVACDVLNQLGLSIPPTAMRSGLASVQWRGRFELLAFDPLVIADGAHTPYSIQKLCASLCNYFPDRRIHFIIGILRDKDARSMLEAVASLATSVTLCDMPARRATPAEQLLSLWNDMSSPHVMPTIAASLDEALARVRAHARAEDVICITGSLHLVAEAQEAQPERLEQ